MTSLFDQGRQAPCPSPLNMAAYVLAGADEHPDKIALSVLNEDGCDSWSYGKLQAAVRGVGTGLTKVGVKPGQIVLMRLGNTIDFPIAYLGAIAAGMVPVPTSAQLTAPETARIISELNPAIVLHDPAVDCADHPTKINLQALQQMYTLPQCDWQMGDMNRLAYIVYTSGTSGRPRAVAHAHRAVWARRMMIKDWSDLMATDRLLHAGAFNWTYTLGTGLIDPWTVGATALIPAPGTDISALPTLIRDHQASIFAAAPGVYRKILKTPAPLKTTSLRHGLSAGEKLSQPTQDAWYATTGTQIFEAYGMSECSTFISSNPNNPTSGNILGRPQTGRRIAIVDQNGPVPTGQPGIIAVDKTDPGLMLGYLNAPADTAARYQDDWFLTGDLASMDLDRQITFLGRNDDMMNAGGYRVSPMEVEAALSKLTGVTQIGVAQVEVKPDVFIIAAFYTGPAALDDSVFEAYVKGNLARYKHPRVFIHLPELPAGANGKLNRKALPAYFKAKPNAQH